MSVEPEVGAATRTVVVLGLGNLLRRDEGLGIRALWRLRDQYPLGPEVQLVDGGTLGLELLSFLEGADRLLVLDAALTDGPPGTLLRLRDDEVPAFFGMRSSPHEVGLPDLLAVTRLRGTAPSYVVLLGMQPDTVELGWDLSATVEARLDTLVLAAAEELRGWGCLTAEASDERMDGQQRLKSPEPQEGTEEQACTK